MDKIDKLLQKAKSVNHDPGVHFIVGDYCRMCKGKCKALNEPGTVIIINDIPKDAHKEIALNRGLFNASQKDMSKADAEPVRAAPDLTCLTKQEREFVLNNLRLDEPEETEKNEYSQKKKFRNIFGYG